MKALFIISNGFEDSEALTTLDLLRRAKIDCDLCSIMNNSPVTSSHNLVVIPDSLYKDIKLEDYDFLVLPGGAHVYKNLHNLEEVSNIINYFYNSNKLIASICAAPSLVSKLGLFDGLKYTCFPGCDFEGAKGKNTGNELEINDKFITARSMAYSIPFALAIIEKVLGKKEASEVLVSIEGLKIK